MELRTLEQVTRKTGQVFEKDWDELLSWRAAIKVHNQHIAGSTGEHLWRVIRAIATEARQRVHWIERERVSN